MSENPDALKHHFDENYLKRLGLALKRVYPAFDRLVLQKSWETLRHLEMKPRVRHIRDILHDLLPQDYEVALKILLRSVEESNLSGFDLWPHTEFIQSYGLHEVRKSLEALRILTPRFTSEWAVRPFIVHHPEQTMSFLLACASHDNHHVRRWASEGTRPRLPWGERLKEFILDPKKTASIINVLKFDDELYVRKSVANHLNDIAKDHPEFVIKILKTWQTETRGDDEKEQKIDWIIKHSLRTLIKAGNSNALKLIGVKPNLEVEVKQLKLKNSDVSLGGSLEFSFEVKNLSRKPEVLVIDYILHFLRSRGTTTAKVFKLKKITLNPGEVMLIKKVHAVKKVTTREYYPGSQALEIQINGQVKGKKNWRLSV